MNIREKIVDSMISKLTEGNQSTMDTARRVLSDRKVKKAQGPNTPTSVFGSKSTGGDAYKASGKAGKSKSALPMNIRDPKDPKKPVNGAAIRGKSINTSRSTGMEGAKAKASQDKFDSFVQKLSKKGK
jgi:hypothetical protein